MSRGHRLTISDPRAGHELHLQVNDSPAEWQVLLGDVASGNYLVMGTGDTPQAALRDAYIELTLTAALLPAVQP